MKNRIFLVSLFILCFVHSSAQSYQPTPENIEARKVFQDNKFGIFLHWGVYSMLASGEWTMQNNKLNYNEYAQLAAGFYPSNFNAAAWVKAIKNAGAKYICFTTRHHDGFSMFDTQASDFNITKASPFKHDVLKELTDACHSQGIKIHFYYSLLDWSREDYPWGNTGRETGRKNPKGDWTSYYQFMRKQLTELLTKYGEVGAIWFDGAWDQNADFDWGFEGLYQLIHSLQPGCLVANNHHSVPLPGEDIQVFERDLPGENNAGYSGTSGISSLPLETCETMNGMWGYKIADQNYKSAKTLIQYLVKAAGKNANLLMNIGPQPDGNLPSLALNRLNDIGGWMQKYGETIYHTRGGFIPPHDWGVTTQKGNKLFVHVLDLQDTALYLETGKRKIRNAKVYDDGTVLQYKKATNGILLMLPEVPHEIDYILELTFEE